jgi:serine/threonine-protein kinase
VSEPEDPRKKRLRATVPWDPEQESESSPEPPPRDGEEPDSGDDPLVGQLLRDKWRVLERLGAGGFGTVYKVQDIKGGWIEALKILGVDRISGSEVETVRKRFLREARIMKSLGTQSQHIVGLSTYEEDLEEGLVYFLMEFVEGRSLAEALAEEGPFGAERTVGLALQICEALIVAHEAEEEVVHRDLKLENIMLTRDRSGAEMAKVLDFGIAKIAEREADSRLTTAGTLGTPGFAAPEQLRAEEVDGRTDLFAFGVILYCLLTGRDPWFGRPAWESTDQIYELMVATERAQAKPMAETGVEVPAAVAGVVGRLLRRDPAERFQSARELKEALSRLARGGDALEAGSIRVVTTPPGLEVAVRSGFKTVAEGPTPLEAQGMVAGTYRVSLKDPRFEPLDTSVELDAGAMEDVSLAPVPRKRGLAATLRRRVGILAALAVLVLLAGGGLFLRPWGRTMTLDELRARAASGRVSEVRLTPEGVEGALAFGPLPAPFSVPLSPGETPEVAEELRESGLEVDASGEVSRLIREAAEAQARMLYFGEPGRDVRTYAQRALALDPDSDAAHSLLLKVGERMAWDADAALREGEADTASRLLEECLSLVPDHPRCLAVGEGE